MIFSEKRYTSKASDIKLFPGHRAGKSVLQQCPGNNLMPLAHVVLFLLALSKIMVDFYIVTMVAT
jgi:hypothetical protein